MVLQDRVVTMKTMKSGETLIPKGTIGTIREYIDGNTIIQYKFENDRPFYIKAPEVILKKATIEDIINVTDYRNLIPKQFHLGQKYAISDILGDIKNQKVGIIISIDLALNEQEDLFELAFEDGSVEQIPQSMLAYHSSYVEYDLEEFKSNLVPTNREVKAYEDELYEQQKNNSKQS